MINDWKTQRVVWSRRPFALTCSYSDWLLTNAFIILAALYLTQGMTLTTLSLCMTVIILNIHHHSAEKPVPKIIRVLFFTCLGRLLCMPAVYGYKQNRNSAKGNKQAHFRFRLPKFPWTREQRKPSGTNANCSAYNTKSSIERNTLDDQDIQSVTGHVAFETTYRDNADLMKELAELGLVLVSKKELNNVLTKQSRADLQPINSDSNPWKSEWPLLASVLDRLFLLIYVAFVVLGSFYLVHSFVSSLESDKAWIAMRLAKVYLYSKTSDNTIK